MKSVTSENVYRSIRFFNFCVVVVVDDIAVSVVVDDITVSVVVDDIAVLL